jgi:hypothetical protein
VTGCPRASYCPQFLSSEWEPGGGPVSIGGRVGGALLLGIVRNGRAGGQKWLSLSLHVTLHSTPKFKKAIG